MAFGGVPWEGSKGYKGGAFMNWISALVKEDPESPFAQCEDTVKR